MADVRRPGGGRPRSFDPDASLPPAVGALCDYLTVEELNAATGLAFVTATPFHGGC